MRLPELFTLLLSAAAVLLASAIGFGAEDQPSRPNILWITSEDNGPHLGCYGDESADTPNLDALAAQGLIYLNCWSTAPVCAPARTALISGLYPTSTGSEHMRSMTRLPSGFLMYPQYLRQAGYYCTNNSKEDYNVEKPGQVWDDSSRKGHWKNRKPGQPFFAIFNHTVSHESNIRVRPHIPLHDASKVRVPAYHPDIPEVRRDWAQYYDKVTEMDALVGNNLRELKEAGLADDTIIFYCGDHGSGMPRSKRWPYNSGLNVPFMILVPEKFRHLAPRNYAPNRSTDRLVGFVDFAPTFLSLAGSRPPEYFQGHAFMGKYEESEQPVIFGFRGRMDERYDLVRVARDKRYIYIRNYMPHKIYGQYIEYMFKTPTTAVWRQMFDEGKLTVAQSCFWQEKPPEELYDLRHDPDEVDNLAESPRHQPVLKRLRGAQQDLARKIRDVGFLPEQEIHARSVNSTPYEIGHDESKYQLDDIMAVAEKASSLRADDTGALVTALDAHDSAVRYWAALGLLMRKTPGVTVSGYRLRARLNDESPSVRVIAASALGQYGTADDVVVALPILLDHARVDKHGIYVAMLANNALDDMDHRAAPEKEAIAKLPQEHESAPDRMKGYIGNLVRKTLADLN